MLCIKRLSEIANVIPLIAKADLLSSEEILSLKFHFHQKADEVKLRSFSFAAQESNSGGEGFHPPFAISSAHSNDTDCMDASLLMSPDYIQPLASSELSQLLDKLFDSDNISWFRHSAAKKLINACHSSMPLAPNSDIHQSSPTNSGASFLNSPVPDITSSQGLVPYPGDSSIQNYNVTRLVDYTHREQQIAQVRLAKWTTDMRRSIQNERERYVDLIKGERAAWLYERIGECILDSSVIPLSQTSGLKSLEAPLCGETGILTIRGSDGRYLNYQIINANLQDPFGLIWWNEQLKQQGWIIVQLLGGVGVVGGLAWWMAKMCGLTTSISGRGVGWLYSE